LSLQLIRFVEHAPDGEPDPGKKQICPTYPGRHCDDSTPIGIASPDHVDGLLRLGAACRVEFAAEVFGLGNAAQLEEQRFINLQAIPANLPGCSSPQHDTHQNDQETG
jgi:hypothetical protein